MNAIAWELATSGTASSSDGAAAVNYAETAVAATNRKNSNFLDTLAAAYAETGQFEKAVATEQEALALAKTGQARQNFAERLKLFQANTPYRDSRLP